MHQACSDLEVSTRIKYVLRLTLELCYISCQVKRKAKKSFLSKVKTHKKSRPLKPSAKPKEPPAKPEEPLEPPPVPEDPGEARPPKKPKAEWMKMLFPPHGNLVYNALDDSMSAHCHYHGARCRAPKTLKKAPIGYYLLWLKLGAGIAKGQANQAEHMAKRYDHGKSFRMRHLTRSSTLFIIHCIGSQKTLTVQNDIASIHAWVMHA